MRTTKFLTVVAACAISLGAAGCSSSGSTAASSTIAASAPTTANAASSPTAPGSTAPVSTEGSGNAPFCEALVDARRVADDFKNSVGTPMFTAKLDVVRQSNQELLAAAPAEVREAATTAYGLTLEADEALDPSLNPADKMAKMRQVVADRATPQSKAAFAELRTWIQSNCGSKATEILAE